MDDFHTVMNGTRAELLNLLQAVIPSEQWGYIRSRILKIMGRNGLESKLIELFQKNGTTSGTGENNGQSFSSHANE